MSLGRKLDGSRSKMNKTYVNVQKKKKKLTLFSPVPISDLIRQYLEKIQKALFVM